MRSGIQSPTSHLQKGLSQFEPGIEGEGRKSIIGTFIGSMEEAQEMLEFCKEKGLTSMIEMVKMEYVTQALERLERNDVRHRFVVDVARSKL